MGRAGGGEKMSKLDHPSSPFENLDIRERGLKHSLFWPLANHLKSIQLVILYM